MHNYMLFIVNNMPNYEEYLDLPVKSIHIIKSSYKLMVLIVGRRHMGRDCACTAGSV